MANLKIGGCVVLYNPDDEVWDNICTYLPTVEKLLVIDNSTIKNKPVLEKIIQCDKIDYIDLGDNFGVAKALNVGCRVLSKLGFDIALTMDQDSQFPTADWPEIRRAIFEKSNSYGIIGLNFNSVSNTKTSQIIQVNRWLTSGNYVNLESFNKVGGFNEELFIDYVDIDLDRRMKQCGYPIGYLRDYSIKHTIGNPIPIHILWKAFYAMNHPPIRCYYRFRNCIYLVQHDFFYYMPQFLFEVLINIPKIVLYEPNRGEKLNMIMHGLRDGLRHRMGRYRKDG